MLFSTLIFNSYAITQIYYKTTAPNTVSLETELLTIRKDRFFHAEGIKHWKDNCLLGLKLMTSEKSL